MKKSVEIIIIKEGVVQSVISDAVTLLTIFAVIGAGRWIDSTVMQVLGVAMLCLGALVLPADRKRLTIAEARSRLDELETVRAEP